MKVRCVMLCIGLAVSSPAAGQDSTNVGFGTDTCGSAEKTLSEDRGTAELLLSTWLDGFLSGINATQSAQNQINLDTTAFPDGATRLQWLISSCRKTDALNLRLWVHAVQLFKVIRSSQ